MPPPAPVALATAYRKLAPPQSPTVSVWICTRGWSQEEHSSAFVSSYASIDDVRVLENSLIEDLYSWFMHASFNPGCIYEYSYLLLMLYTCMHAYIYDLLGTSVRYL